MSHGWTILAAALTNSPRARQKGHPAKIVNVNGTDFLKAPLIQKCMIKYRDQVIKFGQEEFNQMLQNHRNEVWDAPPHIRVGHSASPGLAWFGKVEDEDPAGYLTQEDDWLVAYARPADEHVKEALRGYKFLSIDVHTDYDSNQMELRFSLDDAEVIFLEEDQQMPDPKDKTTPEAPVTPLDGGNSITLSREQYDELIKAQASQASNAELDRLRAENEALKLAREEAKRNTYLLAVERIVANANARRGEDGKSALPAFVLNTVSQILKFEDVGEDGKVIKLDREGKTTGVIDYMVHSLEYLLMNMPIEPISTQGDTSSGEKPRYQSGTANENSFNMSDDDLDAFYTSGARDSLKIRGEVQQ